MSRRGARACLRHDEKVLIEEFVDGLEVECGVLGNRDPIASLPGQIVVHAEWYDFSAKYDEGGMELIRAAAHLHRGGRGGTSASPSRHLSPASAREWPGSISSFAR